MRDNLATFGRFHGLVAATLASRVDDVLEQFGLAADADRKVMDLQRRLRRRVQVAKVFMVETPVVFLDEFSTGMDPILKRSVMARLREEAARGRTIVLTTQILSEAEELCDDILIMNDGRQAARGDLHALKLLSAACTRSRSPSTMPPGDSRRSSPRSTRCASRSRRTPRRHCALKEASSVLDARGRTSAATGGCCASKCRAPASRTSSSS